MQYYLYKRPDGQLELNNYELPLGIFPGYVFISTHDTPPDLSQMSLDAGGQLAPDLDKLKAAKKLTIERIRDRKLIAPVIVYDGLNLDADAQAKSNLADKLAAVNSRIAMNIATPAEMLVWKDYDNKIHSFADLPTYKSWLDGFAVALEERGTAAWSWSWQKKNALDALTTVADVEAFDPTT